MLFLSQKLDIALSRARAMNEEKYKSIHEGYHDWLEKTAKRWMTQCNSVPADAEVGDILNIVEGIHATRRLNLMDDDEDEEDDDDNQDHEEETPTKNGRIQRTASKKAQELLRVVRTMERNHDNRRRRRKGKGRKRKKKQRKLQDFGGGT
jgi:hypothetical protein